MNDFITINDVFTNDEIDVLMGYWYQIEINHYTETNLWNTLSEFKTKIQCPSRNVEIVGIPLDVIPFLTKKINQSFSNVLSGDFGLEGPHYFTKYPTGGFHSEHKDSGVVNGVLRNKVVSIQLTDGDSYIGGDLIINGKVASRNKGSVIIYNGSDKHEVTPVTDGVRFSITECAGDKK